MKVRIVTKPDGKISIIHAAPKSRRPNEPEDVWLKRVFDNTIKNLGFTGLPYEDIDKSELPASREDRDAWELGSNKKIKINATKKAAIKQKKDIEAKKQEILERQAKQELGIS